MLSMLIWTLLLSLIALGGLGSGGLLMIAPWFTGLSLWLVPIGCLNLLGGVGAFIGARQHLRDIINGTVILTGAITDKRVETRVDGSFDEYLVYFISVNSQEFTVGQSMYNALSVTDDVSVEGFPRTKKVVSISRS